MSAHLERAQLLLQQSRPADAEREAMLALAQTPDHPLAHAYLALSRSDQGKLKEALEAARAAVGIAPDVAFFRYVYAVVLHRSERDTEARGEVEEAIRLDPDDERHFALLASIHLARRDWQAALEAAERGLSLNPEDVTCANLRSMALVRLGRKAEAMQTVDFALGREPDNALSHANQGWNRLHRNEPRQAQDHFREALRLDPELEYARQGMLESLKARNPVYRVMLAYFLWMARQSGKMQAAFILVTFFGVRAVRQLAETQPQWSMMLWPVVVLFYAFIYLSWTAVPMFNLLLRLDKFGRYVLSADERRASNWFGPAFLLALVSVIAWAAGYKDAMLGTIVGAGLSICVAVTFSRTGRARVGFAIATAVLAVLGLGGLGLLLTIDHPLGLQMFTAFCIGFFVLQLVANFVR
jgi:Tfp pilus assembly protein PilF